MARMKVQARARAVDRSTTGGECSAGISHAPRIDSRTAAPPEGDLHMQVLSPAYLAQQSRPAMSEPGGMARTVVQAPVEEAVPLMPHGRQRSCSSPYVDSRTEQRAPTASNGEVSLAPQPCSLNSAGSVSTLEVVSVQRHMLHEDIDQGEEDLEHLSHAHVLGETVDPLTSKRILRLRFANGDIHEVCVGAVFRPQLRRLHGGHGDVLHGGHDDMVRTAHAEEEHRQNDNLEANVDGHPSSASDFFTSSDDCSTQPESSSSTDTDAEMRHGLQAHSRPLQKTNAPAVDSDATLSESEYAALGRPRAFTDSGATHTSPSHRGRTCHGRGIMRPLGRAQGLATTEDGGCFPNAQTGPQVPNIPRRRSRSSGVEIQKRQRGVDMTVPPNIGAQSTAAVATASGTAPHACNGHNGSEAPLPGSGSDSDSWYKESDNATSRKSRRQSTRSTCRSGKGQASAAGGGQKRQPKLQDPLLTRFGPDTWKAGEPHFKQPALPFTGPEPGCTHPYGRLPSVLGLFQQFWSEKLQRRIVRETNDYASEVISKDGRTRGGTEWTPLGLAEFKAYLSMNLYMGIKSVPHRRLYWSMTEALFHCPVISRILKRDRFERITRCLHVAMAPEHVQNRMSPTYDKLHKVRWLLDEVCARFQAMWSPNQQLTVDESMVMYKGKYSPIRQYMPKKPVRFGLKIWAAADAVAKYVWNFQVYCGRLGNPHDGDSQSDDTEEEDNGVPQFPAHSGKGEGLQGRHVVKQLLHNLGGRGHIVTTDNFFTSVPLFLDLLAQGIMATGTLKSNRKYVPKALFAREVTKKKSFGWIDYRMHEEGNVCCSVWKDRNAVVLLSTHAEALSPPGPRQFVYRRINGKKKKVRTGPMHLQYTENMRGVDTADQLRGVYSCLTRSHKWWHRLFFYLLDTTICNAWIIHSDMSFRFMEEPLTHLSFQMQLAKELTAKWAGRTQGYSVSSPHVPLAHGTRSMGTKRGNCIVCGRRTNQGCPACNGHMCKGDCYWKTHW